MDKDIEIYDELGTEILRNDIQWKVAVSKVRYGYFHTTETKESGVSINYDYIVDFSENSIVAKISSASLSISLRPSLENYLFPFTFSYCSFKGLKVDALRLNTFIK